MIWRETQNYNDDYFCSCKVQGFNLSNTKEIIYANLRSIMRPLLHSQKIPVATSPQTLEDFLEDSGKEENDSEEDLLSVTSQKFYHHQN